LKMGFEAKPREGVLSLIITAWMMNRNDGDRIATEKVFAED